MLTEICDLCVVLTKKQILDSEVKIEKFFIPSLIEEDEVFVVMKKTPNILQELREVGITNWYVTDTFRHDVEINGKNLGRKQVVIKCSDDRLSQILKKKIRMI